MMNAPTESSVLVFTLTLFTGDTQHLAASVWDEEKVNTWIQDNVELKTLRKKYSPFFNTMYALCVLVNILFMLVYIQHPIVFKQVAVLQLLHMSTFVFLGPRFLFSI